MSFEMSFKDHLLQESKMKNLMFDIAELSEKGGRVVVMYKTRSGTLMFDVEYKDPADGQIHRVQGTIPAEEVPRALRSLAIRFSLMARDEQLTDHERVIAHLKTVRHLTPPAMTTLLNAAFGGQAKVYRQDLRR